jgi:serpin B
MPPVGDPNMKVHATVLVFLALVSSAKAGAAEVEDDLAALVKGNKAFALQLYAQVRGQKGNLVFSPYSIAKALAMTSFGARGRTADQITKTLHLSLGVRLPAAFDHMDNELENHGPSGKSAVSTANCLWDQKGYQNRPLFQFVLAAYYRGELKTVDFRKDPEAARQAINAWMRKKIQSPIKEPLQPQSLNKDVRLVLASTASFQAAWQSEFSRDRTARRIFFVTSKKKVRVPMMSQRAVLRYYAGPGYQALMLPFSGKRLQMLVILPTNLTELADLEKSLEAKIMASWRNALHHDVFVTLPRFQIEGKLDLKKALSRLGMATAFVRGKAEFPGITLREKLYLSAVVHISSVEVNEKGIGSGPGGAPRKKAANEEKNKATASAFWNAHRKTTAEHFPPPPFDGQPFRVLWDAKKTVGAKISVPSPMNWTYPSSVVLYPQLRFWADRPFLFVIFDTWRGHILFLGRVTNPKPSQK